MDTANKIFENPYVMTVVKLCLIGYASKIMPKLPDNIEKLFSLTWFKIMIISLIIWVSRRDFQLALLIGVVFVLGMNGLSGRLLEGFAPFSSSYIPQNSFKLISPQTDIMPGCLNITLKDLLTNFDNDSEKLQKTISYSYNVLKNDIEKTNPDAHDRLLLIARTIGLPYDVELNDENAPLIATILVMKGWKLSDLCRNPHGDSQNAKLTLNDKDSVMPNDSPMRNFNEFSDWNPDFSGKDIH